MKRLSLIAFAILLAAGCAKEYDDTAIKNRVDSLEDQVQDNANTLRKLSSKLAEASDKGLTLSVTETADGKILTFSDGTTVTVQDGAQGSQGSQGQPGEDGEDAVVSITESSDGLFYVINMGGNQYTVAKTQTFSLTLAATELSLDPGASKDIAYTLSDASDATVFVQASSGYTAVVDMDGSKITVTAPVEIPENGFVIITARKNSTGEESSQYIGFLKGSLTVTADAETVSADGGVVTLTVNADCGYSVIIPEDCTWIERVESKAMTTSYVYLKVAANPVAALRSATVRISSSAGNKYIVIAQEASSGVVMDAANSFIISESGTYMFRTVKGNSQESVGDVASCELLWETYNTEEYPQVNCLIKSVSYADGKVTFETVTPYKEGNAGIAVKDADGNILWSWHIWLTDRPAEQVYYNGAGTFMDRNLGAYSATPGDVAALGFTYQWGRKDPFLSTADVGNRVQVGSTLTAVHDYVANSDWPVVNTDEEKGTVEYAIAHPTTYIACALEEPTYDWLISANDDLWDPQTKTIYDPCPAGWRVPSHEAYCTATGKESGWFSKTGEYDASCHGSNWSKDLGDDDMIWYTIMGYRGYSSGVHSQIGIDGHYWTSTPSDGTYDSYRLYQDRDNGKGYFKLGTTRGRSYAYPVRCMKEQ